MLCNFPREILEHVALELVMIDPVGPLTNLANLKSTCKHINNALSSNVVKARIFCATFDSSACLRRLGPRAHRPKNLAEQLLVNHKVLATIHRGDIFTPAIEQVFWRTFLMLLESDGKNRIQLMAAGLDDFIERFVHQRLLEDSELGWPADNTVNSLALWIFSMTLTEGAFISGVLLHPLSQSNPQKN